MPILIKAVRIEPRAAVLGGDVVVLTYDLPSSHQTSQNCDGQHEHYVSVAALLNRHALYGCPTIEECLEEIVYEALTTEEPDRFPGKVQRDLYRRTHGVVGLAKALRQSGITLPYDSQAVHTAKLDEHLNILGTDEVARIRGVSPTTLPAPPRARGTRPKGT